MLFILYIQTYIFTLYSLIQFTSLSKIGYMFIIFTYIIFVYCNSPLSITVHLVRHSIIYAVVLPFPALICKYLFGNTFYEACLYKGITRALIMSYKGAISHCSTHYNYV